jgi:hypothetical protein
LQPAKCQQAPITSGFGAIIRFAIPKNGKDNANDGFNKDISRHSPALIAGLLSSTPIFADL